MSQIKADKPTIHVLVNPNIEVGQIKQLLYGMEEEQVPYEIQGLANDSAIDLSYQAAFSSRLGVGVGIGKDNIAVLHFEKLKKEEPLFRMNIEDKSLSLRALGVNAARLVKGMPFKELELKEEPIQSTQSTQKNQPTKYDNAITREKVTEIVRKVLSELAKEG